MAKIDEELKASKKYYLEEEKGFTVKDGRLLVKLSKDNVARVEAMIHHNSDYGSAFDVMNPVKSACKFQELKKVLEGTEVKSKKAYRELIEEVVASLDKENSTHLNTDGCGIKAISKRIADIEQDELVYLLKNPKETGYKLIEIIAKETKPVGQSDKGNPHRGRRNLSFASKFCHYACFYLFDGKHRDNYSIYDSIVSKALPSYMERYGIEKKKFTTYAEYQEAIDEVIKKSRSGISRNGFDHLLWYCYK